MGDDNLDSDGNFLTLGAQTIDLSSLQPLVFRNDDEIEISNLECNLDAQLRLILSFSEPKLNFSERWLDEDLKLQFSNGEKHDFITTSVNYSSTDGTTTITGVLARSPVVVNLGGKIATATGNVVNLNPDLVFTPLEFETKTSTIIVSSACEKPDAYKVALRQQQQIITTAKFSITPKTIDYSIDELTSDISSLWDFFRFITGSHIGFGQWTATDAAGRATVIQPEIGRYDPLRSASNWADFYCGTEIQTLFGLYQNTQSDTELSNTLRRVFELYRTSTSARHFAGIETGIILAQSALELLSDYILSNHFGWSHELKKQVRGFHSKLTASATSIGFRDELFGHLPHIKETLKSQKIVPIDEYQIITLTRNDITHAKRQLRLSGLELLNVWDTAMFLVELHIFFLLGYRGQMADRRRVRGWKGETIPVPLS